MATEVVRQRGYWNGELCTITAERGKGRAKKYDLRLPSGFPEEGVPAKEVDLLDPDDPEASFKFREGD
jgi:hypothetical protein